MEISSGNQNSQEDPNETDVSLYEAATSETGYPAKRNSKNKNNRNQPNDDGLTFAPIRKNNKSSKYSDM
jgi:hypothetical protein